MGRAKRRRDPTALERQARYRERMYAAGYVRLSAWVHERDLERVNRYLTRLRREGERAGL